MNKKSLSFGSFLLMLGVIIYEFGLLMTLHQQVSLITYITNAFPDIQTAELVGILLQLIGGIIVVSGFVSAVSNIVSIILENNRRNLVEEILIKFEERIRDVIVSKALNASPQVSSTDKRCQFCGAGLKKEDIFCPVCGKSQK